MKFIHIADVHIGATPDADYMWGSEREKEIIASFQNIITICNEQQIELLLIAGDLFHKQPLIRELKEVNYYFEKLTHTQVVLIAGNHDYISARSNYNEFTWNENVYMLSEETMDSVYLEELNTEVYGFSYHTRDITDARYNKIHPGCEERINILLAHGGDEKNIPINKKELLTSGFDYIALGHIHKPELFGDRMAYSGSLEPMDKNEIGPRGYILGEIQKEGEESNVHIDFISNSHRQYIKAELPVHQGLTNGAVLDMAKDKILENGKQNIYQFVLTGIRDTDILFQKGDYLTLGNVIEIIDKTVPDYNFDALYEENRDNIIGLYIKRIREQAQSGQNPSDKARIGQDQNGQSQIDNTQIEIAKKALYYGIEALLGVKK